MKNQRRSSAIRLRKSFLKCYKSEFAFFIFFYLGFFHEYSQFTGHLGKGEGISLYLFYLFRLLHRHLDISLVTASKNSPLRIAGSQTRTGNLWFPSSSR